MEWHGSWTVPSVIKGICSLFPIGNPSYPFVPPFKRISEVVQKACSVGMVGRSRTNSLSCHLNGFLKIGYRARPFRPPFKLISEVIQPCCLVVIVSRNQFDSLSCYLNSFLEVGYLARSF